MPERDDDAERILKMMIKPYVEAAYAKGRADERAAIVAWLLSDVAPRSVAEDIAAAIERGEHVDARREKP